MTIRANATRRLGNLVGWTCAAVLSLPACGESKPTTSASADISTDIQLDDTSDGATNKDTAASDGSTADTVLSDTPGSDAVADIPTVQDGGGTDASPADSADVADSAGPKDAQDTTAADTSATDAQPSEVAQDTQVGSKEAACLASGGTVQTSLCCGAGADFPNLCAIGACGCAPQSSKDTKVCSCPKGMCFDGAACVFMAD